MPKLELRTAVRPHKTSGRAQHFVELIVDGVIFETPCVSQDAATNLVVRTALNLGIKYKKA